MDEGTGGRHLDGRTETNSMTALVFSEALAPTDINAAGSKGVSRQC